MNSIFENVRFLNDRDNNASCKSINLESGLYIKDCSTFITDDIIEEYFNNDELIRQYALLEGAKVDALLSNFINKGKDHNDLKKKLEEVVEINNINTSKSSFNGKKSMQACKKVLSILYSIINLAGPLVMPMMIVNKIASFVISTIINKIFVFTMSSVEFNSLLDQGKSIVAELRSNASKAKDKKTQDKLNYEADRLEESINKYMEKTKK